MTTRPPLPMNGMRWTAILLVIATVLFSWAILAERGVESRTEVQHVEAEAEHLNAGTAESEADEVAERAEGHDGAAEENERLLGINLEDPVITWSFVVLSLVLAAGLVFAPRIALIPSIAVAGGAALLDVREVLMQTGAPQIAILAAVTALAHAAVVVLAILFSRSVFAGHKKATS